MLDEDDLEAAVAEGIISSDQVEKLRAFADSRRLAADRADDERFHFMRGFNDFFFAVGIVLLGAGIAFFAGGDPVRNLVAAALIWALAEFRTGAGNEPVVFFATLVILGAMVLALGVGWQPLRRQFLRIFPPGPVGRLPPAAYPA